MLPNSISNFAAAPSTGQATQTKSEIVYGILRADIISGTLLAEERLRIERLSQTYGVGPTPLREALQRLSADGLVLATGNRGFSVAPLNMAEFRDLNIARIAVEKEALRLSISGGDDAWEASLVAAGYSLGKQDAALDLGQQDNLDLWGEANAAFHLATVAACGSVWLLRVRQRLHDQCERYRRTSVDLQRAKRDLQSEHRKIQEAVLDRDSNTACDLIEAHFQITEMNLADVLDERRQKKPA